MNRQISLSTIVAKLLIVGGYLTTLIIASAVVVWGIAVLFQFDPLASKNTLTTVGIALTVIAADLSLLYLQKVPPIALLYFFGAALVLVAKQRLGTFFRLAIEEQENLRARALKV